MFVFLQYFGEKPKGLRTFADVYLSLYRAITEFLIHYIKCFLTLQSSSSPQEFYSLTGSAVFLSTQPVLKYICLLICWASAYFHQKHLDGVCVCVGEGGGGGGGGREGGGGRGEGRERKNKR